MVTHEIKYKNRGVSCKIELPEKFELPFYGAIMDIKIIYTGKEGTAFTSKIFGSNAKIKRHFVTNETFVQSYGKYRISVK